MRYRTLLLAALALGACADGPPTEPRVDNPPGSTVPDTTPRNTPPSGPLPAPTEVGAPTGGASVSATIGAQGGTLVSADERITIAVPAGAMTATTPVSIQPIRNHAHGGTGTAYRLAPHGVTFAKPVRLTFRYTEADVAGSSPHLLRVAYQDADRRWRMFRQPVIDTVARTISVETTHFSDWSVINGVQLTPASARVRVNRSLELRVQDCFPVTVPGTDLVSLVYECRDGVSAMLAGDWYVNGNRSGGAAGTITPSETAFGVATYTAPASIPSGNPVAVSVEYRDLTGARSLLISHVTVEAGTSTSGLSYTASSRYGISWWDGSERVEGSATAAQHIETQWTVVPAGMEGNRKLYRLEGVNRISLDGTAEVGSRGGSDDKYRAQTVMTLREGGTSRNPETSSEWMTGMAIAPEGFGPVAMEAGRLRTWQEGGRHLYELHYNPSQVVPSFSVESEERWACRDDKEASRRLTGLNNITRKREVLTSDPGDCFVPRSSVQYPGPFMFGSVAWNPMQLHPLGGTWTALRGEYDPRDGFIEGQVAGSVMECLQAYGRDPTQWGQLVLMNIAAISPPTHPSHLIGCSLEFRVRWRIEIPD